MPGSVEWFWFPVVWFSFLDQLYCSCNSNPWCTVIHCILKPMNTINFQNRMNISELVPVSFLIWEVRHFACVERLVLLLVHSPYANRSPTQRSWQSCFNVCVCLCVCDIYAFFSATIIKTDLVSVTIHHLLSLFKYRYTVVVNTY